MQINTEEHVDAADQEVILWDHKIPEDILKEIATPKEVPAESVTVWIDPLDATQEYTGDFTLKLIKLLIAIIYWQMRTKASSVYLVVNTLPVLHSFSN